MPCPHLHRTLEQRPVIADSLHVIKSRCPAPKQEAEHQRAKAERQAELAVAAELARASANDEVQRLRSKFARSDKGTALLKAARLKMELEACREKLASAEAGMKEQVWSC